MHSTLLRQTVRIGNPINYFKNYFLPNEIGAFPVAEKTRDEHLETSHDENDRA